jgi:hypothetical protein
MTKGYLLFILLSFSSLVKAQPGQAKFDSTQIDQYLDLASYFISCENYNQAATDRYKRDQDISSIEWITYLAQNRWHTAGIAITGNSFTLVKNLHIDSLGQVTELPLGTDTAWLSVPGSAVAFADQQFQLVRDTCNLYFNTFVHQNTDQTISVWFLPAFQPSGQAIYGCEWEYIFDKTGMNLLKQNAFTNKLTGVWIGQPREIWLNYRNTDKPTAGSVFFALSFRDYFTRLRIDTRVSTSTIAKSANGEYTWTHKMK